MKNSFIPDLLLSKLAVSKELKTKAFHKMEHISPLLLRETAENVLQILFSIITVHCSLPFVSGNKVIQGEAHVFC